MSAENGAGWTRHLAIGRSALAHGLVDLGGFAAVSAAIGAGSDRDVDAAWLGRGGLTPAQLAELLSELLSVLPAGTVGPAPLAGAPTTRRFANAAPAPAGTSFGQGVRYEEIDVLGVGGMGKVIECKDALLGRRVALKRVRPDYIGRRGDAALMLEREARLTGGLEHPNIIPVYDAGEHPQLGPQYVMRLVDQPTLEEVLYDLKMGRASVQEQYRLGRLLRYLVQVCEAVDYAHSRGVVHCDLKPANILLGAFGEVIVVDWGLAYSAEEGVVYRGGTIGYMAPEQLDAARKAFDARTDVFALGCILYEVLTLERPFSATLQTILNGGFPPTPLQPPSARTPHRNVPPDLEEIAMAALALEPARRLPSARAMASALEAVIEGTKERERRRARADELAAEGDDLAKSHYDYVATRPTQVAEIEALRETVPAWQAPAAKTNLWAAEDRLAVDDSLGLRILQAAISAFEQALAQIPDHAAARRGLARLYHSELVRAQQRRDRFNQNYFEELIRLYDDGTITRITERTSNLAVACVPDGVELVLTRLEESERRLLPAGERPLGAAPVAGVGVEPGYYSLAAKGQGLAVARYPLIVSAGQSIHLRLDVRAAATLDAGEILVPGGPALVGGGDGVSPLQGLREVQVPGFVIGERPITVEEYLRFLDVAHRQDPERAAAYVPSRPDGVPYWERRGDDFAPVGTPDWGRAEELRALPVFGVDAQSAEAYAAWRSSVTGRRYRLPSEHEWEKAARGTDGRRYPWGDMFDASFCKMRDSRPAAPRPEPSGAFAADVSPYGVCDMAGGIADWVVPATEVHDPSGARLMVTRGGAWCDWQIDCVLASRRPAWATERAARVGFRLVREP